KRLLLDSAERSAFKTANVKTSLSRSLFEPPRSFGWNVRPDALVIARSGVEVYERLLHEMPHGCWAPPSAGEPPLVSVVVPYFNLAAYLPETLASLAAQTWPRLEVLVIDDGSDDPEATPA